MSLDFFRPERLLVGLAVLAAGRAAAAPTGPFRPSGLRCAGLSR